MKRVMVFGTFDIFHKGHQSFLKQARKHGEYIIAVVARDKTVETVKKQRTENSEQERKNILGKSKLVDMVILGSLKDKYSVIKKYKPAAICLGYDQKFFIGDLRKKLKEFELNEIKIVRLKSYHPRKYKSSLLKNKNGA